MSKLLSTLEKKPFQAYTIEHGIEKIQIQVPLKNARAFEVAFGAAIAEGIETKAELLKIMDAHGGHLRQKKQGE